MPQRWTLVELDPALIAAGARRPAPAPAVAVAYRRADLARALEEVLAGPVHLVTCSALLDLVSADWLARLVRLLIARDLAFLAVLSYDGLVELEPPHPLDREVIGLVNRHQRTEKGFGPALGPEAVRYCTELLRAAGEVSLVARSDWRAGPADAALQRALIMGWSEAARAIAPERTAAITSWQEERLRAIEAGLGRARVGHLDLLRLPRRERAAS